MKKFFSEFKTFITRGNVLDMAVGVIVGGAFTAIVNALTNNILKPIVNWILALIFGSESLDGVFTFLHKAFEKDEAGAAIAGKIDLTNSIYIDWGAFISAIINFLLIALVLFIIVKMINKVQANREAFINDIKKAKPTKEEKQEMKEKGLSYRDPKALAEFRAQKQAEADAKAAEEARIAAEKEAADRAANPTSEDLLKQIVVLLQEKK